MIATMKNDQDARYSVAGLMRWNFAGLVSGVAVGWLANFTTNWS
jgi:hypothetical protein